LWLTEFNFLTNFKQVIQVIQVIYVLQVLQATSYTRLTSSSFTRFTSSSSVTSGRYFVEHSLAYFHTLLQVTSYNLHFLQVLLVLQVADISLNIHCRISTHFQLEGHLSNKNEKRKKK
jgi:hypothetical protein